VNTSNDQDGAGRNMTDLSPRSWPRAAYIGLGANLGDRLATLNRAVEHMATLGVVESVSPVYETEPVGFVDQPAFLNAVLCLATDRAPEKLMSNLLEIEQDLGRVRSFPNAPRSVDLDLLLVGEMVIQTTELTVPHPRLQKRSFVLVPLSDIAPDIVHPVLGVTIRELLKRLAPVTGVCQIDSSLMSNSTNAQ